MTFSRIVRPVLFTPARAAELTGVDVETQRNWRKRGLLPSFARKHARFDPFQLAQLAATRALSTHDVGPTYARPIAEMVASSIVGHALLNCPDAIQAIGPPGVICDYQKLLQDSEEIIAVAHIESPWRFAVTWPNGLCIPVGNLSEAFSQVKEKSAVVLDLEAIGNELAAAVDGPLFLVTVALE